MAYPVPRTKYILAPMAGVTDAAFRTLCSELGAGMTFTEFVSAEGIMRDSPASKRLLEIGDESPIGAQIFGSDPQSVERAAKYVEPVVDAVDFNMGCPAWHVYNQGCGSALLQSPELVEALLRRLRAAVSKPLSIKIRSGIDAQRINCVLIAKLAQECGVDALTLHPRTQRQGYSGQADWDLIRQVKQVLTIPVFGNGDVRTPEDAAKMLSETGCDAVMIGRAGKDAPWLFRQCVQYECTGAYEPVSHALRLEVVRRYMQLATEYAVPFARVRRQLGCFTKGMQGGAQLRAKLGKARDVSELLSLIA